MKRLSNVLLFSLLPILTLSAASLHQSPGRKEEGKKVEAKKVPLASIYSTSHQKGLKWIERGRGDNAFPNHMRELYQQSTRIGASNVFLARGDDIAAAVKATWEVFTRWQSASKPVSADWRSKSEQYWLVVYLGVEGSDPPEWLVSSVIVSGKEIQLIYTSPGSSVQDLHPYFVWVPLGKLGTGTYTLEMFDEEQKQVTLSRRVAIPGK